jgi:hypothetical protein
MLSLPGGSFRPAFPFSKSNFSNNIVGITKFYPSIFTFFTNFLILCQNASSIRTILLVHDILVYFAHPSSFTNYGPDYILCIRSFIALSSVGGPRKQEE